MSNLSLSVATDIASAALDYHVKGDALSQTTQERPLLAYLEGSQETFPGGKEYLTMPVQGKYMEDTAGFMVGYTEDESVSFAQAANLQRAQYKWYEMHAGFIITMTELTKDGISVTDDGGTVEHADVAVTRLTAILKNRLADFSESWARAKNKMLWKDGTQDAKVIPGVTSILQDTNVNTVGGLSQVTYTWWKHRVNLNIATSPSTQGLSNFLRNELIQLKRYGGRPNKAFCGSLFWDALMQEVTAKGQYTQTGFVKNNDFGVTSISLQGLGTFEYDPSLDDMGYSKRVYILAPDIKLKPIEGEANKTWKPSRPYQYMVMLKSMTYKGALGCKRMNGMAVYGIA